MKTIVLYHAGCWDGLVSAWLVKTFYDPGAECVSVNYGTPIPFDIYCQRFDIVIVDFSYPRIDLDFLKSKVNSLTVLDHHKTAQAELSDCDYATFDMNKSGAVLTLDWVKANRMFEINPTMPMPFTLAEVETLCLYIQDRDLWQFKLHDSREVIAYIRSFPISFESIPVILKAFRNSMALIETGYAILRTENQIIDSIVQRTERDIDGVPTVNTPILNSEVGQLLCRLYPKSPYSVTWFVRKDGKTEYSLRSIGDFDCSAHAKKYGGGGHKNAAGYVIDGELEGKRIAIRENKSDKT